MKWSPSVVIGHNHTQSLEAAKVHFEEQKVAYGKNCLVNLIDMKGSQLRVGKAFSETVKKIGDSDFTYEWFDFHHECRKMKYENLSKLLAKIKTQIDSFGYF